MELLRKFLLLSSKSTVVEKPPVCRKERLGATVVELYY